MQNIGFLAQVCKKNNCFVFAKKTFGAMFGTVVLFFGCFLNVENRLTDAESLTTIKAGCG